MRSLLFAGLLAGFLSLVGVVAAQDAGFPYEIMQLEEEDVEDFPSIQFGDASTARSAADGPRCKAWPGGTDWPGEAEWKQLNVSLGGALLRPEPAAAACYPGPQYDAVRCRWLVQEAGRFGFWIDDPLAVLTQWPQGSTCTASLAVQGTCTRGGSPEYVVKAGAVKHIQAAVNFARNKNVRLVVKNTGHDFGGRSTGAGSLSIWTHNLKDFEFIPNFSDFGYTGMAVRVGAGVEAWELRNHAAANNITVATPGGSTVGVAGGWIANGGHGPLTSKLGLGSDQLLSINLVTADGEFVTANPETNRDLWWAIRGGGPGTFGVVTSIVMRAFPPIRSTSFQVAFSVNPNLDPGRRGPQPGRGPTPYPSYNITNNTAPPTRRPGPTVLTDVETFWKGVKLTYRHCPRIQAAGGYCYSYIYPQGNSSFRLTHSFSMPNITTSISILLMQPLYDALNDAGINVTLPRIPSTSTSQPPVGNPTPAPPPPTRNPPGGGGPAGRGGGTSNTTNTRYRSRLFPRANWDSDALYDRTWTAIRTGIEEGGYTFHGIAYTPTESVAGPIGADSAVNPAWRRAVLHGSYMETQPAGGMSSTEARVRDARVRRYTDLWRAVTPGAGAYLSEGDVLEADWQQSFYGLEKYGRLLAVKNRRDPWGVFWAPTTPGAEGWEVITLDGYPGSQNGRLCRKVTAELEA